MKRVVDANKRGRRIAWHILHDVCKWHQSGNEAKRAMHQNLSKGEEKIHRQQFSSFLLHRM